MLFVRSFSQCGFFALYLHTYGFYEVAPVASFIAQQDWTHMMERAERNGLSPVPKRKYRAAVLHENPRSHFRWRAATYCSGSDPVQSGAAHLYARHSRGIHLPEPELSGRSYPFHRCGRDPRTFKPIWRTGAISSIVAQPESGAHIWQNQRRR